MTGEQTMKPATAAKKLNVYLPATPAEFQEAELTRAEFQQLQENPPEWLSELRRTGPHPRPIVASRLGVSISGLNRAGITEPLTTDEIRELLEKMPQWLVTERSTQAAVRAENTRVKQQRADK
jgi:hypothetical protein